MALGARAYIPSFSCIYQLGLTRLCEHVGRRPASIGIRSTRDLILDGARAVCFNNLVHQRAPPIETGRHVDASHIRAKISDQGLALCLVMAFELPLGMAFALLDLSDLPPIGVPRGPAPPSVRPAPPTQAQGMLTRSVGSHVNL